MDIESQKIEFWNWYYAHRDDDFSKEDMLKLAYLAGFEAAQQSRAVDLGGARENFCELHNTNYVLVGYCPICHPNH